MRPLGGVAFSTAPPARLDGTSPAVRPVTDVVDGTIVPITFVIDHGPGGDDVRMCRVDVENGSGLGEALAAAKTASTPAACVTEFATAAGPGGVGISSLNDVAASADYAWRVQVDGASPRLESDEPIGFGDLVFLKFEATVADPGPATKVVIAPVKASKRRGNHGPRVSLRGKARWNDGVVEIGLRCPRALGAAGCRGLMTAQFRKQRGGRLVGAGSAAFAVGSGSGSRLAIPATASLRKQLADRPRLKLRLTAATRGENGAVRLTHAKRFLAG